MVLSYKKNKYKLQQNSIQFYRINGCINGQLYFTLKSAVTA